MKVHKHKDIEFTIMSGSASVRRVKTYEDAYVTAVEQSIMRGKPIKIYVFAYSTAAKRWWEQFFGNTKNSYAKDPESPIAEITVRASAKE